jgi:HSP20 family protein
VPALTTNATLRVQMRSRELPLDEAQCNRDAYEHQNEEGQMAIMRWDPFAEVDRMFELLSGRGSAGPGQPASRGMPMDVYRDGDKYVVEMDLPGVDPSSIDINIDRNLLTVTAEGRSKHEQADEVVVCERRHVRYRRQLYLGESVDTDKVNASYNDGVLRLEIPISKEQRPRKIEVTTDEGSKSLPGDSTATRTQGDTEESRQRTAEKVSAS